jgi:hypothetical protein
LKHLLLTVAFLAMVPTVHSQTPAAPAQVAPPKQEEVTLTPPVDSTKAQLIAEKQKNLQMTFTQLQSSFQTQATDLQKQFKTLQDQLDAWIADVKKDHKLGDDVTYDATSDKWVKVVKPKKEEAKAASDKK